MPKIRRLTKETSHIDLIIIIILTVLLIPIVIYIGGAIRIIIGLPFLLFFPGYTLIAALFPKKDAIGSIERVALSLGLSIAVVPLIGLILNYTWEISLYPVLISIISFIFIMCAITWFRRRQLPPEQRFQPGLHYRMPTLKKEKGLDRVLTVALAVAMIAAIGTLIYVVSFPRVGEKFTEFYILNSEGVAADYPTELRLGQEVNLIIGITNHESANTRYQVRIQIDGEQIEETGPVTLENGQKWEANISFAAIKIGDEQKAEFLLFESGESAPSQELHIWINVSVP